MSYAEKTSVPAERSRNEIERMLSAHGADAFGYATQGARAIICFNIEQRSVRIELPLPKIEDFKTAPSGRERTDLQRRDHFEQEVRRRWRALALVIKAKLVAVVDGISTIEREFLADVVTADGRRVIEVLRPRLEAARGKTLLIPEDL